MIEYAIYIGIACLILVVCAAMLRNYRDNIRYKTLHKSGDTFVWIEWPRGQRMSGTDPSIPNGEWDCGGYSTFGNGSAGRSADDFDGNGSDAGGD
jgi:hypothetical protein